MSDKTSQNDIAELFAFPIESIEATATALSEASDRGAALVARQMRDWQEESRRFGDEFSTQAKTALDKLAACRSPADVLAVEQAYMSARAQSYMDSALRWAHTFAVAAEQSLEPSAKLAGALAGRASTVSRSSARSSARA